MCSTLSTRIIMNLIKFNIECLYVIRMYPIGQNGAHCSRPIQIIVRDWRPADTRTMPRVASKQATATATARSCLRLDAHRCMAFSNRRYNYGPICRGPPSTAMRCHKHAITHGRRIIALNSIILGQQNHYLSLSLVTNDKRL